MVLGFCEKVCLWFIRIIQWCLAISLLGISGHFITLFSQANNSKTPPEVWLPVIGSAFAICHCFYSIILLCCLGRLLMHIAAFFDFCFVAVFIATVVLNRHNFSSGVNNQLYQKVVSARDGANITTNTASVATLVQALVGLSVTLLVLFFITFLLSLALAHRADDKKEEKRRRRSSASQPRRRSSTSQRRRSTSERRRSSRSRV